MIFLSNYEKILTLKKRNANPHFAV